VKKKVLHNFLIDTSQQSFVVLYQQWYTSFCYFANRYVKEPQVAEDIVSDVALKVWEKKDDLKNIVVLKNYFYTSIRNACINYINKEKSRKERINKNAGPLQESTILENIIRTETLHELELAIENLPTQCRKVFIKLFKEGKTLSEAAEEMGLSIFTIKAQRQRGIQLLRKKLIPSSLLLLILLFVF
jgi:RNA polymerase sigma-70 factor (family 1)